MSGAGRSRGGGSGGGEPAGDRPISVSQLASLVGEALSTGVPRPLRVVGEISGFRERTHWYFDLKDAGAVINVVMFAAAANRAGFVPEPGQEVVITGRVEFFGRQGRTQLYADAITPVGEGALDLAFRRLHAELAALGWFDDCRKRALPRFPRRIAVVTSRSAAALQDVLETLRRRCPMVGVVLADVRVQGDGAAEQVAEAIGRVNASADRLGIDAILVTRGGGSREDLWAFNERVVAEAIVKSALPVVAAIGHETDITIAELAADVRASTPTQAAVRLSPDAPALEEQLDALASRARSAMQRWIAHEQRRLTSVERRPVVARPAVLTERATDRVREAARRLSVAVETNVGRAHRRVDRAAAELARHRPAAVYADRAARLDRARWSLARAVRDLLDPRELDDASDRLDAAWRVASERRGREVEAAERALNLVGPASVLARGFSVTTGPDGKLVRSAGDVGPGETVRTRVADGLFASVVSEADGTPAEPIPAPTASRRPSHRPAEAAPTRKRRAPRRGRSVGGDDRQLDLFNHPG